MQMALALTLGQQLELVPKKPIIVSSYLSLHHIHAAPSSKTGLTVLGATSASVTVQWEEIPCLELNSRLEEYVLEFTPTSNPLANMEFVVPVERTNFTVTGLASGSNFSVSLLARYTISDADPTQLTTIALPITAATFSIPGES